jgi:hypothetical protein
MKNHLHVILLYLVVVSLVAAGISISRFETTMTGSSEAVIGRPVIDCAPVSAELNGAPVAAGDSGIDISNMTAGDELVYKFNINNFKGEITNEVLLKYRITVSFDPHPLNIPLTYTLTPDDEYQPAGGDGWALLGFDGQETHSYTLTVTWDESKTDPAYLSQQQSLRLIINAEQTVNSGT